MCVVTVPGVVTIYPPLPPKPWLRSLISVLSNKNKSEWNGAKPHSWSDGPAEPKFFDCDFKRLADDFRVGWSDGLEEPELSNECWCLRLRVSYA